MNSAIPEDKIYMQRCIELARNGELSVSPNPMVGCVIVYENKIIGEGYHQKFGEAHAEVNAINAVKDEELLKKSTLYVNLEPCAHYGKTPPCSDLIVKKGIPRVVIANVDPYSKVAGKGIEKLRNAGCIVDAGILEEEGYDLNKFFFTSHQKKRPYIILKWAESADGYIDKIRSKDDPVGPNWITNENSRQLVHKWRAQCQAIMVGANTVKKDNPALNVRTWPGENPVRVIFDRDMDIPQWAAVFDQSIPTLVFTFQKQESINNLEYVTLNKTENILTGILNNLYQRNIISLFVEGGTRLLQSFIDQNLWDEARVFRGNRNFNEGIPSPIMHHAFRKIDELFDTQIIHMFPKNNI